MSERGNKRPASVPASWECAPCVWCQRPTWFDPAAHLEAHVRGVRFAVVCSANCAVRALGTQWK